MMLKSKNGTQQVVRKGKKECTEGESNPCLLLTRLATQVCPLVKWKARILPLNYQCHVTEDRG